MNGHDEVNIFDRQQVESDFAVPIFFQIFQGSDNSSGCRLECI